jgi:DNA-directed RNA polymerase specialized sigma24 family protein
MLYYSRDSDKQVMHYQKTGDAEPLIQKYANFLNKYYRLLAEETIDFSNYDIRYFISCYIADKQIRAGLRGKYYSNKHKAMAYQVLKQIKQAFEGYSKQEIKHELIIILLKCAKRYQPEGKTFTKYLYRSFRYGLIRRIDKLLKNKSVDTSVHYFDEVHEGINWEEQSIERMDQKLKIELDEDLALNDPLWLKGEKADNPFKQLTREERLILAKYYYEEYTDKQIGQLLGRNPKSIHRIRKRCVRKLEDMIRRGEIKWIRLL